MICYLASNKHVCLLPLLQTYVVQATQMKGIFLHKITRALSTSNIPSFVEYSFFLPSLRNHFNRILIIQMNPGSMRPLYLYFLSGKVQVHPIEQATKAQRGSTLSLTSAIGGVGGQLPTPAALPPGKTRCPLY